MFLLVAEDMGVAELQFAGQRFNDVFDGEALRFAGQLGVEDYLKQEIAQFFFHVRIVFFADGLLQLLRLFKEVFEQGFVSLLAEIPTGNL